MKKIKFLILLFIPILALTFFNVKTVHANEEKIYLGGYPAGFTLYTRGAYVVGLSDVVCEDDIYSPAKDADVQIGDIILYINDYQINTSKDISDALKNEQECIVQIKRGKETLIKTITPKKNSLGEIKLGLFIKEGINGIGTITYFTNNKLGCLGHPVLNDNYELLEITGGKVYDCSINGVIKSVKGRPGELRGVISNSKEIGNLEENCTTGVYGTFDNACSKELKSIEIGTAEMGKASIWTTLNGCSPKEYSISIIKVDTNKDDKNFVIKVTDKELLEITGGIVQGMSGSPIVQNGKLVGAITHVFMNDPTRGFGISIENMINHKNTNEINIDYDRHNK